MMHDGGGMAWWMIFGLVLWIALIGLGGWALGRYLRSVQPPQVARKPVRRTPLEILERRYAEGSIDAAEFDEARARIREDGL